MLVVFLDAAFGQLSCSSQNSYFTSLVSLTLRWFPSVCKTRQLISKRFFNDFIVYEMMFETNFLLEALPFINHFWQCFWIWQPSDGVIFRCRMRLSCSYWIYLCYGVKVSIPILNSHLHDCRQCLKPFNKFCRFCLCPLSSKTKRALIPKHENMNTSKAEYFDYSV